MTLSSHFIQIQHLLKLNKFLGEFCRSYSFIQIQHLLKLNLTKMVGKPNKKENSNTTLVKVKFD